MTEERKVSAGGLPRLVNLRAVDDDSKFDCMLVALDQTMFLTVERFGKDTIGYIDYVLARARAPVITDEQWEHEDWVLFDITALSRVREAIVAAKDSQMRLHEANERAIKADMEHDSRLPEFRDQQRVAKRRYDRDENRMLGAYTAFLQTADWSTRIHSPGVYKQLCAGKLE